MGKEDLFNTDAKALLHRTWETKIVTKPDSLQVHEKLNYLQNLGILNTALFNLH